MLNELLEAYRRIRSAYNDQYATITRLRKYIEKCGDVKELADIDLVCREAAKYLDDIRKEFARTQDIAGKLACMIWVSDADSDGPIRGRLSTATPNLRMTASLPNQHRDPEQYAALMNSLGVPEELRKSGVVMVYWPKMVDYLSTLCEQGKPMPAGIDMDKTYPAYSLTNRLKKGVELDDPNVLTNE